MSHAARIPHPTPGEPNPLRHDWVVAATVPVSEKVARHANLRLSFRAGLEPDPRDPTHMVGQRINALETYCSACRRPLDDVADKRCEAKVSNVHLIGGNPGERAKRKVYVRPPGAKVQLVAGPTIRRRGIDAYVAGGAIGSDD